MKVYRPQGVGRTQTVIVEPAADYPENSDWVVTVALEGETVRRNKQFTVRFTNGEAEVERTLGRYLIEKGHAQRSPLLLPDGVAA